MLPFPMQHQCQFGEYHCPAVYTPLVPWNLISPDDSIKYSPSSASFFYNHLVTPPTKPSGLRDEFAVTPPTPPPDSARLSRIGSESKVTPPTNPPEPPCITWLRPLPPPPPEPATSSTIDLLLSTWVQP